MSSYQTLEPFPDIGKRSKFSVYVKPQAMHISVIKPNNCPYSRFWADSGTKYAVWTIEICKVEFYTKKSMFVQTSVITTWNFRDAFEGYNLYKVAL